MSRLRTVPVIALCAIYLFLAAGAALLFTGVYRTVEADASSHSSYRVTMSYLLNRLRAGDSSEGVGVTEFGDGDALVFPEGEYETTLYCYNGYLMELFTEQGLGLGPESGDTITEALALSVEQEGNLLKLTVVDGMGAEIETEFLLRSDQLGGLS